MFWSKPNGCLANAGWWLLLPKSYPVGCRKPGELADSIAALDVCGYNPGPEDEASMGLTVGYGHPLKLGLLCRIGQFTFELLTCMHLSLALVPCLPDEMTYLQEFAVGSQKFTIGRP